MKSSRHLVWSPIWPPQTNFSPLVATAKLRQPHKRPEMKIATYNMRSGGRGPSHWRRIENALPPDILLAQEAADPTDLFATDPEIDCTWSAASSGAKQLKWGSAVIVRGIVRQTLTVPGFEGWIVGAEIDAPKTLGDARPLRAFSLHAPTRTGVSYVELVHAALDAMAPFADGAHLIIGGDFNLTISPPSASESRKIKAQEQAIQERLRIEFALANCWRSANPEAPLAQTLRWSRDPSIAYHIDGLFVPLNWLSRLRACHVVTGDDWLSLSDHNPIIAEFDFG